MDVEQIELPLYLLWQSQLLQLMGLNRPHQHIVKALLGIAPFTLRFPGLSSESLCVLGNQIRAFQ